MHLKTLEPIHPYIPKPLKDARKRLFFGGYTLGLGFRGFRFIGV